MKTILVPTDFSDAAHNASTYAFNLAKKLKTRLRLCNALYLPEKGNVF
ncbi:universal stress protein [Pedobacter cryoconitis]